MLDIKLIRANPEQVKKGIAAKNEMGDVDQIIQLDEQRRTIIFKVEDLKKQRNENSNLVSAYKKDGKDASEIIQSTKNISRQIKEYDIQVNLLEEKINILMSQIPNMPHESTPYGKDPDDNVEVRKWGAIPEYDFKILNHLELGERLDILDFKRGGKIAGSGFPVYKGLGARLERALINFMLDLHIDKHNYTEIFPPFVANRESMYGTAQLPKLQDDMYHAEKDDIH